MARPRGARSAAYAARQEALLREVSAFLLRAHPARPSFREIAAACGVSQPTLRHYFGNREGLIAAHLARAAREGAPYVAILATTDLPLAESLHEAAMMVLGGFTLPEVGVLQAAALAEGLASAANGPAYLNHVLDPALDALAARLGLHMARGELRQADPRLVATLLLSPIAIAALHQDHLGGRACNPLDLRSVAAEAAEAVLRAYGRART